MLLRTSFTSSISRSPSQLWRLSPEAFTQLSRLTLDLYLLCNFSPISLYQQGPKTLPGGLQTSDKQGVR